MYDRVGIVIKPQDIRVERYVEADEEKEENAAADGEEKSDA